MPETIQDLERLLSTTYTELQIDHESSDEDWNYAFHVDFPAIL